MFLKILKFVCFLLLLAACKQSPERISQVNGSAISPRVSLADQGNIVELKSGKHQYSFLKNKLPLKKVVLLNASLAGYFTELGLEDRIAGVSSPEYLYSPKLKALIGSKKIADIGNEQKYDVEQIIALKPDAIFTNYIEAFENTYQILRKYTRVIFLDEYLEQQPLDKARYLLVFGRLFNREKEARAKFSEIEGNYRQLAWEASKIQKKPTVIANEMYGNQWFMPGGKTQLANYLRDAGASYILKDTSEEKAVPMSFEEVMAYGKTADFWVNAGNHLTRTEMSAINGNYQAVSAFQKGRVYSVSGRANGRANDFFESGNIRADLVLQDYVRIFHPEILPQGNLVYLKKLE